jgi:hypothetical protein
MSDPIVLKTPLARIDLTACFAYIGERSLDSAHRFRLAAETTDHADPRLRGLG